MVSVGPHGTLRVATDDMVCDKANSIEVRHRVTRHSETDLRAIISLRRQHDGFGEISSLKFALGFAVTFKRLRKVVGNAIPQMASESNYHIGTGMFGDALARRKD